jgi:hypothetical protein
VSASNGAARANLIGVAVAGLVLVLLAVGYRFGDPLAFAGKVLGVSSAVAVNRPRAIPPAPEPLAVTAVRVTSTGGLTLSPAFPSETPVRDASGTTFVIVRRDYQRPTLMRSEAGAQSSTPVPTPGDVQGLAVDGDDVWVVADWLGCRHGGVWSWTPWPAGFAPKGLAAGGGVGVAWGSGPGGDTVLAVSRDHGATVALAPMPEVGLLGRLKGLVSAVGVDAANPARVMIETGGGAFVEVTLP